MVLMAKFVIFVFCDFPG